MVALPGIASAGADNRLQEIATLLDSGRVVEAPVFAPRAWEGAYKAYTRARSLQTAGQSGPKLEEQLRLAEQGAQQAIEVAVKSQRELSPALEPRQRARDARAQFLVSTEYGRAEEQMISAARRVESGDVEGGLAEAHKTEPLFDAVELSALHKTVLQTADSLLAEAGREKAQRYAPATLAAAQSHRTRSHDLIAADRAHREEATKEAAAAEYEARHALQLARYVRDLEANQRSWEEVLLGFEGEASRLTKAAGAEPPRFDGGLKAGFDTAAARLGAVAQDLATAGSELGQVSEVLSKALAETGESSPSTYPVELASQSADRLFKLTEEKSEWARMAAARQEQLAEVSQMADETAFELSQRRDREEKFKAAQKLLAVSEGVVLYNDRDDIVLRLTGLSFEPGQSDLHPGHARILSKVEEILKKFESHQVVVEGYTDARGTHEANLSLSEKRAQAVRERLLKDLGWDPATMEAKGNGDAHPVASNSTADGRAKNRRIDVVILK